MSTIKVLGIDLGKSSFHLIGRDSREQNVFRKQLSRKRLIEYIVQLKPCTIAFEACGGAHWLGRFCQQHGHTVKLIPPQYVKPYVKGNKSDFIDADAIAEASGRPNMRFVRVKTEEAQTMAVIHRLREAFVAERTATMCRIGAILLEFGIALPVGHATMKKLFTWIAKEVSIELAAALLAELSVAHQHYLYLNERIAEQDLKIKKSVKQDELCQLAKTVPGVGDMVASQLVMEVGDASQFRNGREMAAWLGLVPRQHSTGGKTTLLGISKRGNKRLRCLFVHGARALMSRLGRNVGPYDEWLNRLLLSKRFNVVCIALANKLVRVAWAVLSKKEAFVRKELSPGLQ